MREKRSGGAGARGARSRRARTKAGAVARDRVGEIQRSRMLAAMAQAAAERGAAGATVAQIVARSGVSRRTFYELFEDREDCFMAAFEQALTVAGESVIPAFRGARGWREGIRAGLVALLRFLDEHPDKGSRGLPPLTAEGIVGAVLGVIHARMLASAEPRPAGRRGAGAVDGSFLELANPLMATIVLPYLGLAAAQRELQRSVPHPGDGPPRPREDPLRDLDMRLTYRTVRVLQAAAAHPGASNRQIAEHAGVTDQGQISKLLTRLQTLGLVENTGRGPTKGEANAWTLTARGHQLELVVQTQTTST
jgi:AcrR family transcriptional regulator